MRLGRHTIDGSSSKPKPSVLHWHRSIDMFCMHSFVQEPCEYGTPPYNVGRLLLHPSISGSNENSVASILIKACLLGGTDTGLSQGVT